MIRKFQVGQPSAGLRLDLFLAGACSDLSRSRIQKLIKEGAVLVGGATPKRSHVVHAGDEVSVEVPEPRETAIEPEEIPLTILYEDEHLVVVDKPAGLLSVPTQEGSPEEDSSRYGCRRRFIPATRINSKWRIA